MLWRIAAFSFALVLLTGTAQALGEEEDDQIHGRNLRGVPVDEVPGRKLFWGPRCPRVSPVSGFDLNRYIEKSWFVQMQQVNPYQQLNQLYCVTATYQKDEQPSYINVFNYGNNDQVNGSPQTSYGNIFSRLCAHQQGRPDSAELGVAPCILRKVGLFDWLAGPYWVIALDKVNYEWAIISGGQPTVVKQTNPTIKCTTNDNTVNGSGLWLFTREPTGPRAQELTQAMLKILDDMGVFTGELKKVQQEGCRYNGAALKL